VGLKWLLFLVGLLLIGVGSVKLRPPPAGRENPRLGISNSMADDGLGGFVSRLPPLARYEPTREEHLSDGSRFMVAGVVAWPSPSGLERSSTSAFRRSGKQQFYREKRPFEGMTDAPISAGRT